MEPDESHTRMAASVWFGDSGMEQMAAHEAQAPPQVDREVALPRGSDVEYVKGTGDVLNGRFVLEERLGSGGMSTVYKALDRRKLEANDRNPYVAVKVLNVEFRAHRDSLIALQREAKKSQTLAHPNIVRVYDFDRDGLTVYMTMEYLAGQPLAKTLRSPKFKGMGQTEAIRILGGMASALAFAHDNYIVHADFKPGNVILTDSGQVKVIDFGIARAFQKPDVVEQEATRFDPGTLGALTPTYASPEMIEHREPDPRDDIYALACITYEMLTGRHPFGRMQATEARDTGLELERSPNLSRRQYKALKSALAFDRQKRTPSVRQFLDDIRSPPAVSVSPYTLAKGLAGLVLAGVGTYYLASGVLQRDAGIGTIVGTRHSSSTDTPVEPASVEKTPQVPRESPSELGTSNGSTAAPAAPPVPTREADESVQTQVPDSAPAVTTNLPTVSTTSVRSIIGHMPCVAADVSVQDGAVALRGYVSRELDLKRLERDVMALQGAKTFSADLTRVSEDKCAVIDLYSPYWVANREMGYAATLQVRGTVDGITEGEPLVVDITTPPYESYVSVDYYSLNGNVVHMVPSPRVPSNQAPANYKATLGDLGEWTISKPFGTEMVALLVTPQPLFPSARAESETEAEYLAAIREQLERLAKQSGKDKVAADFVMIHTRPKPLSERPRNEVRR
jgi:serine/threonine protein kinase